MDERPYAAYVVIAVVVVAYFCMITWGIPGVIDGR